MSLCCRVALVLFFSLLAGTFFQSQAALQTGELSCQCKRIYSGAIPSTIIYWIYIYAAGPHCATAEVIVTTTEGRKICVDPKACWVREVINEILERVAPVRPSYGSCTTCPGVCG